MKIFKKNIDEGVSDLIKLLNSLKLFGAERSEVDHIINIVSQVPTPHIPMIEIVSRLENLKDLRNESLCCQLLALAMCSHFSGDVEKAKNYLEELKSTTFDFKKSDIFYNYSYCSSWTDKVWASFFPITTPYFANKASKRRYSVYIDNKKLLLWLIEDDDFINQDSPYLELFA